MKEKHITLLGTRHQEIGACNLDSLIKIIEKVSPEVTFLEMPPSEDNNYYINKSRSRLETDAIIQYSEENQIGLVSVDLEVDPKQYVDRIRRVHMKVESNSHEYRRISDWTTQYTVQYGFPYLNSSHCAKLYSDLEDTIMATLNKLSNEELIKTYSICHEVDERRENEMINNIYKYCNEHDFEKGLFMIGASHRESIIDKIQEREGIIWNYENYESIFPFVIPDSNEK